MSSHSPPDPISIPFEELLESAPDAIVIVNRDGVIVVVNKQTEALFGYQRGELLNQSMEMLVPERFRVRHASHRTAFFALPHTRAMGANLELFARRRDGTEFPVEISLSPLTTAGGLLIASSIRDVTERHDAAERIKASLAEKEVLLREIHHRVKNNMQIISSLLQLQSGYLRDPADAEMFRECQTRIRTMAMVHDRLCRSGSLATIDFAEHLRELAGLLARSLTSQGQRIALRIETDQVELGIDLAIPLGLIATEMISNAYKHAFRGRAEGSVTVRLTYTPDRLLTIIVQDDGVGLPPGLDIDHARSLGLRLIKTLARQSRAEFTSISRGGTRMEVNLKI